MAHAAKLIKPRDVAVALAEVRLARLGMTVAGTGTVACPQCAFQELRAPAVAAVAPGPPLAELFPCCDAASLPCVRRCAQLVPGGGLCLLTHASSASDGWRAARKCLAHSFSVEELSLDCEAARAKALNLCEVLASVGPGESSWARVWSGGQHASCRGRAAGRARPRARRTLPSPPAKRRTCAPRTARKRHSLPVAASPLAAARRRVGRRFRRRDARWARQFRPGQAGLRLWLGGDAGRGDAAAPAARVLVRVGGAPPVAAAPLAGLGARRRRRGPAEVRHVAGLYRRAVGELGGRRGGGAGAAAAAGGR